jgi:hypothetical protein
MSIIMAENMRSSVRLNVCIILFGKAKAKRRFGKHRYEGKDNIQIYLKENDQGHEILNRRKK